MGGKDRNWALARTLLLIASFSVMWAWWAKQFHEPKCGPENLCRFMASTKQQGLVIYIGYEGVNVAACPPGGSPAEMGSLTATGMPLFLLGEPRSGPKPRTGSKVLFRKKVCCRQWEKALLISSSSSENLTGLPKRNVLLLKSRSGSLPKKMSLPKWC